MMHCKKQTKTRFVLKRHLAAILKFLSPALISPPRLIINQSLITGIFLDKFKIAKVSPSAERHKDISHAKLEPTLNVDKIERVDNFNFLGVVIDKHNIRNIVQKCYLTRAHSIVGCYPD